jgi:ubiquinone biosynthesis protein COQ9
VDPIKDKILAAALPAVAFDGWTESVLQRAAKDAGVSEFDARRAFPNPVDAIDYFSARADTQMMAVLTPEKMAGLKIREKIATAVMTRLQQQSAHREAIRRALGVYALPWNAAHGLRALYATVDAMWRAAGDTSTDYNFYTKRLLLSKVYSTTLRVWLDDASAGFADTEAFLRRRIEDVMKIEKLKAKARQGWADLERWIPKRRA